MKTSRMIGIGLVVLGIVLLYYGYSSTQSPVDKIYKAAIGRYTDDTLRYLAGGVVAVVGGVALAAFGRK